MRSLLKLFNCEEVRLLILKPLCFSLHLHYRFARKNFLVLIQHLVCDTFKLFLLVLIVQALQRAAVSTSGDLQVVFEALHPVLKDCHNKLDGES